MIPVFLAPYIAKLTGPAVKAFALAAVVAAAVVAVYLAGAAGQKGRTAAAESRAERAETIARDNATAAKAAKADADRLAAAVTVAESQANESRRLFEEARARAAAAEDGPVAPALRDVLQVLRGEGHQPTGRRK